MQSILKKAIGYLFQVEQFAKEWILQNVVIPVMEECIKSLLKMPDLVVQNLSVWCNYFLPRLKGEYGSAVALWLVHSPLD